MTTAVQPIADDAPETTAARTVAFGDLSWFDTEHEIYAKNKAAWERDERRYFGGDAVLSELTQFGNESTKSYDERKTSGRFVNFPRSHAAAVTGTLSAKRPMPGEGLSLGGLGEVRKRGAITGPRSFAELVWYNADGVGDDGSEFPTFFDAVDELAQVTGHRWVRVESPPGSGDAGPITVEQVERGQRPFLAHDSPLVWHNWLIHNGQLQWAISRMRIDDPVVAGGAFSDTSLKEGYYLFVRAGYANLGPAFQDGGWFVFDSEKGFVRSGTWARTAGQIPMAVAYGQKSAGCKGWPAMSQSSTMELGQIAVGLMNTTSARLYDFWDACASRLFFLNAGPAEMTEVNTQVTQRNIYIGVPPVTRPDGSSLPVGLYDGSLGTVAAQVSDSIIAATYIEAREQSFQQITSTPDSSGESKDAGFREQKSPYLAKRARLRQQVENSVIRWLEQRFGVANPTGFSEWPADWDNAPLVDAIDSGLDTLKRSGLKSKTAIVTMALLALEKRGLVNDLNRAQVLAELNDSFDTTEQRSAAADAAFGAMDGAGDISGVPPTDTEPPGDALPEKSGNTGSDNRTADRTAASRPSDSETQDPNEPGQPPASVSSAPDLAPIEAELAALSAQVAALIQLVKAQPEPTPPQQQAPVILPITMPLPTSVGKTVTVTTPDNRSFTVTSTPNAPPDATPNQ